MKEVSDPTFAVFPTLYLPSISWMNRMKAQDEIVINGEENFEKSTDRNRCRIAGANGVVLLSIPIVGGRGVKSKTKDVRINYEEPWQQQHWKSIRSAYGKSSFFHFYEDRFRPFYEKQCEFLIDFNAQLLKVCFDVLHWEKKIDFDESQKLKALPTGQAGKSQKSNLKPYNQVFEERHGFIPDLSILDLIFNAGNEADFYLT